MQQPGYFRNPALRGERLAFAADDDLWLLELPGSIPRRLTTGLGNCLGICFSPDGNTIAFVGTHSGYPELYVIPALGGMPRQLTFMGSPTLQLLEWSSDGRHILISSPVCQPFFSRSMVYSVPLEGGWPVAQPYGPAASLSLGPGNAVVLARHGRDPAQWKRYRGGRMGRIWIDDQGTGQFRQLLDKNSNMVYPMWIGDRIFFVGDHEGIGNIYSCRLDGKQMRRHTHHSDFYVRNPRADGKRIVYQAGGELFILDLTKRRLEPVTIDLHSAFDQIKPRLIDAAASLEDYTLHPAGHSLALTVRGKAVTMPFWEQAPRQSGAASGAIRYRLATWLNDGERIVTVSDAGGEEGLEIFHRDKPTVPVRLAGLDIGRPISLKVSPVADHIALTNQRQELIWIDLATGQNRVLDRSPHSRIQGFSWSPDGRWIAYGISASPGTSLIKIAGIGTDSSFAVTQPVLRDYEPVFDPDGKYLYFLSARSFDPVADQLGFDYTFPRGIQIMLVTLRRDIPSPFDPLPRAPGADAPSKPAAPANGQSDESGTPAPIEIDVNGILDRSIAFPLPEARYRELAAAPGKIYFTTEPVEGLLNTSWLSAAPEAKRALAYYDLNELKTETLIPTGVSSFMLSRDGKALAYRSGRRLRVLKAGDKPDEKADRDPPGRKSGWIDLNRIRLTIEPAQEWEQMYRETWRLLRDHYFTESLAGVDWELVYQRYLPLIKRITTRHEFSDIAWELGGELGTSHAYEIGGDYRRPPARLQGFLGVDLTPDVERGVFRIAQVVKGDSWDASANSPLNRPGLDVPPGTILAEIDGRPVTLAEPPSFHLSGKGGTKVSVTLEFADGTRRETVVEPLRDESKLRLRAWINANMQTVHSQTGGRVGYVYVPDMGPRGFAEFHRTFLAEIRRDALIIDVRNNSGGHVSPLLLQKLALKRLGYSIPRYGEPEPSPSISPTGVMVCLTDEFSGSDGDIFSHTYKMLGLGPLIGKRTWGGIVGLNPTHPLVDGAMTTQPEFYNWFNDVGWSLENCGAIPDINVEYRPQDFASGADPQLERGIAEVMDLLALRQPGLPDFGPPPSRILPRLPAK